MLFGFIASALGIMIAIGISMFIIIKYNSEGGLNKSVHVSLFSLVRFFIGPCAIPFIHALMVPLACEKKEDGISYNVYLDKVACFKSPHVVLYSFSVIFLIMHIFLILANNTFLCDHRFKGRSLNGARYPYLKLIMIAIIIFLTIGCDIIVPQIH